MASREERLQQRLRGAQTRQVGEVDFGLVFAPVSAPEVSPSVYTESQSSLPVQSSTQPPANPQSSGQKPSIHNANTSAKLRKLNSNLPLSSQSTRSSQRTPRPDLYTALDDEQNKLTPAANPPPEAQASESAIIRTTPASSNTPRQPTPVRTVELVAESPTNAPGSGRRLRTVEKVTLTGSQLQFLQGGHVEGSNKTPIPQKKRKRTSLRSREHSTDLSQDVLEKDTTDLDLDELSPQQTVRSSKRMKRVVQQTVSKPSSEPEVDEQVEAEGIDDRQAAILLSKNRPRRSPRRISEASPDLDLPIPSVQNKRRGKHQFEPSPAQQRQPKANPKTKKQSSKPVIKDYGSPIPVIVHRLAQATNFSDDNFDVDVLNLKIPRAKRGDPNAVDVLSQVCEEIVTSALEALSENAKRSSDPAVRREYKTKYHGVEAFGRELQIRLLEHTINLDNGDSLQRRLRDEQKRKLTLREQISHIRAEREQVALKMDKIRIRHENETKKVLARESLNSAIHDIEAAVELGKSTRGEGDMEGVGTELLLKRVAGQVSSKNDSGGLLRQLKEANAFFERAALVLEGRTL